MREIKFILFLAVCFFLVSVVSLARAQNVTTFIPAKAYPLLPDIKSETAKFAPEIGKPEYFAALFEHESCLSLTHSRCMSPTSEYTRRDKSTGILVEQGVGLSMITRAWRPDGAVRFDTLQGLKNIYRTALKDLNWDNIKSKPDLQIRMGILLTMENWRALEKVKDPVQRLYMTDAAYNGGMRDLHQERTLCGLKPNCNPQLWFGHVEKVVYKGTAKIHNGRSSYEINRHHVHDVFNTRMNKYKLHYTKQQ